MQWLVTQALNILIIPLMTKIMFQVPFDFRGRAWFGSIGSALFLTYLMRQSPDAYTMFANFTGVFLTVMCLKIIKLKNILLAGISLSVYSLLDYLARSLFANNREFYSILILFGVSIVILLFDRKKKIRIDVSSFSNVYLALFIPFFLGLSILFVSFIDYFTFPDIPYYKILLLLFLLFMVGVFNFMAIDAISKKNLYECRDKWNQKMLQSQKKYYLNRLESEQKIRKLKHDWNNHLFVLNSYANEEDIGKIKSYLVELDEKLDESKQVVKTNHHLFNIILSDLYQDPKNEYIRIEVQGDFPSETIISDLDFCTLFSNLLKNAFEATAEFEREDQLILLSVSSKGGYWDCQIKNPMKNKFEVSDTGSILSTKDRIRRGVGLSNVHEIVEKYHGQIEIKAEKGFFICYLVFEELKHDVFH